MANATITAWLKQKDQDYQTGVALYDQFGKSVLQKAFFKSGKGPYHLQRLVEALTITNNEIPDNAPAVVINIPTVAAMPFSPRIYSLTDAEWDAAPEQVKDLYRENQQLTAHAVALHHQVRVTGTADQRLNMALQILNDRDKINVNWAAIKEFQATGKLKEQIVEAAGKTIDELTVKELTTIIKNYPSYISKDTASLKTMKDGAKKDKVSKRLQERIAALELATKRLSEN